MPGTPPSVSVAASVPAWARRPVVATKARNPVPAASTRLVSKAVRCRCSVVCPSAASGRVAEVRLSDLQRLEATDIDLGVLKAAGIVSQLALSAKVILAGEIKRKVSLVGVGATKGARSAIEAAGGSVQDPVAEKAAA